MLVRGTSLIIRKIYNDKNRRFSMILENDLILFYHVQKHDRASEFEQFKQNKEMLVYLED